MTKPSLMATTTAIQPVSDRTDVLTQLRRPGLALLFIAAFTFVLYYGTMLFEFVWDDYPQIVNNPLIRSWHSVSRIFVSDLWFHTARGQVYYRPLFIIWEILNFKIFGLKAWGWHLSTVLLHVMATSMVYWLARVFRFDHWTAALAALLFGVHPVHIECAAWVSAGSDSMCAIFYMAALVAYGKAREHSEKRVTLWFAASCGLFACALLAKEMAVTLPIMVVLYEWICRPEEVGGTRVRIRRSAALAAPYVAITLAYVALRRLALHRSAELQGDYTTVDILLSWPIVLFSYLRILLFPRGITGLYYVPYAKPPGLMNFVLPLLFLSGVGALIWFWFRRKKDGRIVFFALWMLLGLLPILYLRLFAPGSAVRDRYMYLPSIGFVLLVAQAIRLIRLERVRFPARALQLPAAGLLCAVLAIATLVQQVYWGSNLLLFHRGHILYPQNRFATLNLADSLIIKHEYGRALPLLTDMVERYPTSGLPYYYLAQTYIHLGQPTKARQALESALTYSPEYMDSETGTAELATLFGQLGEYDRAIGLYRSVLAREPNLYSALYNCGYAYFATGNDQEAEKLLSKAEEVSPDLAPPVFYLGRVYLRTGRLELAENYLRRALSIDPRAYDYHYWFGQALAARGHGNQARNEYAEELRLYPENPNAIAQLGAPEKPRPQKSAEQ